MSAFLEENKEERKFLDHAQGGDGSHKEVEVVRHRYRVVVIVHSGGTSGAEVGGEEAMHHRYRVMVVVHSGGYSWAEVGNVVPCHRGGGCSHHL